MSFTNDTSLYDILDIKPDASPQEVREAYLRTKAAYNKDSVALYTLISTEERENMLAQIQEAYETLSNADRRREYDRHHGILDQEKDFQPPVRPTLNRKIISIDRVPPMEHSANSESLLIAPTTDFTDDTKPTPSPDAPPAPAPPLATVTSITPQIQPRNPEQALTQEIAQEIEWKGSFLRRVREGRKMSIEELSGITKVSKNYLQAIEEENFPKLPAPVFLRGFVTQLAKTLRIPHEQVVAAYMARFQQSRAEKTPR
ncbi:helix-turn-helix domain-containing protein [Bdellovibrionota bacterium FG-1]